MTALKASLIQERNASPGDSVSAAWRATHGHWDPFEAAAFHVVAKRTLGRLLAALDEIGVPALIVKGALLAHTVYADPVERPMCDLDLKVRPSDLARVARFFRTTRGARIVRDSRVGSNVVAHFGGMEVDVESRLGPPLICALGVGDLLARARRTSDALGFEHWRIDVNDHALLLAIDLFKDHVGAKPWASGDLRRIALSPSFDATVLAARAREARCTTIVHVAARKIAEEARDPRWARVASTLAPARPAYARRMLATLAGTRRIPRPLQVLEARGASDSRARSLGSIALSAWWRWTEFGPAFAE